jgi:predicted O-linked N-acetylglucosamine transferase (SPINDLY family)
VSLVPLSKELSQAQAAIAGLGLHVLVFGDVGMEALTTYLSYARMAPVQVAFWGHPSTTGTHTFQTCKADLQLV